MCKGIESRIAVAIAFGLMTVTSRHGLAQTFPKQPIRLIIPFAPGGGSEFIARVVGQKVSESIGQQVVVDNRPGGNTIVATELLVRAPADGHTLILQTNNLTVNPTLYKKLSYDTLKDLAPVSMVAGMPHIVVVHPSIPARNLKELVALAKAKPGSLNYASAGSGTTNHLCAELFKTLAGVSMTHVPYKSGGQVMPDLLGGHVDLMFAALPVVMPHIKTQRIRALALTTSRRFRSLPDLPTISELGYRGYDFSSWFGVLAPAATPRTVIGKLNQEIVKAVKRPDVQDRLAEYEVFGTSAEEFSAFIKADIVKAGKIVRDSGASIE